MDTIGSRIKTLRKSKNITQAELAQALHASREALAKWETDAAIPTAESVKALASYFSVSTDYLLTGDNKSWMLKGIGLAEDNPLDGLTEENRQKAEDYIRLLKIAQSTKIDSGNNLTAKALKRAIDAKNTAQEAPVTKSGPGQASAAEPIPVDDPVAKYPYPHQRLKALRKERGLTIEEAAKQMGGYMTPERLAAFESGDKEPDPSQEHLFYKFYKVTPAFIKGWTNERIGTLGPARSAMNALRNEENPDKPPSLAARRRLKELHEEAGLIFEDGEEWDKEDR